MIAMSWYFLKKVHIYNKDGGRKQRKWQTIEGGPTYKSHVGTRAKPYKKEGENRFDNCLLFCHHAEIDPTVSPTLYWFHFLT